MNHSTLEEKIGYRFKQPNILNQALTHASKSSIHLERQEFLGDAVLGLTITEYLYHHYPKSTEGILSKMRANLVCKEALLAIAEQWKLADFLNVGDGERFANGHLKSTSIAGNAVESVIGAVFQDGGWEEAKEVVLSAWASTLQNIKPVNLRDAKSALQELTQAKALGLPEYVITDAGANASPRFQANCMLKSKILGTGYGDRKKTAELNAAQKALESKVLNKLMT